MGMVFDLFLQAVLILGTIFIFLLMHDIPRKILSKFRSRDRPAHQAKRHFVQGAQLLSRARSSKTLSSTTSLAEAAVAEADKSISLDPKDAASHILKSLALDLQGFKTSALDSIDVALSPLAVKSLSDQEKGDALVKRAELKIAMGKRERVDSAIEDLVKAVSFGPENSGKAYRLLGECYEVKEMKEEAIKAYEDAIKAEPELTVAREALDRLGSSSSSS